MALRECANAVERVFPVIGPKAKGDSSPAEEGEIEQQEDQRNCTGHGAPGASSEPSSRIWLSVRLIAPFALHVNRFVVPWSGEPAGWRTDCEKTHRYSGTLKALLGMWLKVPGALTELGRRS